MGIYQYLRCVQWPEIQLKTDKIIIFLHEITIKNASLHLFSFYVNFIELFEDLKDPILLRKNLNTFPYA